MVKVTYSWDGVNPV